MVHYIQRIGSITNIQNKRNAEIFDVMEHVIEYYKRNNMYTEYYKELEYVYVRYAFCSSFLRIVKIKDSKICLLYTSQHKMEDIIIGYGLMRYGMQEQMHIEQI